jgi:hypothetical protein
MQRGIKIRLTKKQINKIFEKRNRARWTKNLVVYGELLEKLSDAHAVHHYERSFNYFYQVRRNAEWRKKFYGLFYSSREKEVDFAYIMNELFIMTGRVEASFASKLLATLNPEMPIIDRHVLSYIERKLPPSSKKKDKKERIAIIIALHKEMEEAFTAFLKTEIGQHLLDRFRSEYPTSAISQMKMLDFVLWQSGGKQGRRKKKK